MKGARRERGDNGTGARRGDWRAGPTNPSLRPESLARLGGVTKGARGGAAIPMHSDQVGRSRGGSPPDPIGAIIKDISALTEPITRAVERIRIRWEQVAPSL